MRGKIMWLAILCSVAFSQQAAAQYYNTGESPASQRWKSLGNDSLRMIFPDDFEYQARRTFFYMNTLRPYINYGFSHNPLRAPVIFKTENFFSNGLGMLAPKRIEIGGIPSIKTYSEPWLKQLAAHEYRHMVQYGNVNQSTVKVFGWLFGQQAPLLATGLMPFWFIEGDAVMTETQASSFGRAMQPSFTMHYRALGDEILRRRNPDKWFCGSYKDYVPSHYELGFQLVSYADRRYDTYIGDNIADYTSKFPFLIFTTQLALNKYHDTSTKRMFRETFASLNELWSKLEEAENSPRVVSPPVKRYTTYSFPLYLDDERLLALKTDYDRPSRFVEIDLTAGTERTVCHTGIVSTRPVRHDNVVAWTEYRQSMFWQQKVDSRLCVMDMAKGSYKEVKAKGNSVLYPVIPSADELAWVKYDYDGTYSIEYSSSKEQKSYKFRKSVSLHGLTWDATTQCFYYIALSDDGMWIGGVDLSGSEVRHFDVKSPAYVTIGDLSAADGMLYFNSIYSGKDEVHTIDIAAGSEYRISNSRYGSFSASPSPEGEFVALTTYERDGYKAAVQEVEYWEEIEWAPVPHNIANAPLKKWGIPLVDDIVFKEENLSESQANYPAKRYNKATHLLNVHSWAPLYYSPDELLNDYSLETQFGATAISQNLLSSMDSYLGYGYSLNGYSTIKGSVSYNGWAPKFDIKALWSNQSHAIYDPANLIYPYVNGPLYAGNTFQLTARVRLPMLLSSGYRIRSLTPSVQYNFSNIEIINPLTQRSERSSMGLASIQYSESVRRARLDLQPRWGYTLRTSVAGNPFSNIFSTAWSVYGRVYTPGLFLHHGLTLAAAYQQASDNYYMIGVIDFQPRGYNTIASTDYLAASANYTLPIAYPDWGLSGIFFLKRIALNLGFEYAQYTSFKKLPNNQYKEQTTHINTYGATLHLDITPFRMPDEATSTLSIGVYKPRDKSLYVTVGFSVPL